MKEHYINEKLKINNAYDIEEHIDDMLSEFDNKYALLEVLKEFTLHICEHYSEYLDETVDYIIERLLNSQIYDGVKEYMDSFFGDYCENLGDLISDKSMYEIGKAVWNSIKNESKNVIRYDIGEERYNKFATAYDDEYWLKKLEDDEYIRIEDVYEELFKTPEKKLLPYADKIAEAINSAWSINIDQKNKQRKILKYLEKIGYCKLLDRILECDELSWDHSSYGFAEIAENIAKQDREDRISVEEANEIIKENDLQNILEAIEGYVGLEDMKFDYLIDKRTNEIISEDGVFKYLENGAEVVKPWIRNRDFGDKKMRKSWLLNIVENYKSA